MFEDLNVWMFECLCLSIAGLRLEHPIFVVETKANLKIKIEHKTMFGLDKR
jgi:hypothetical protein